MTCEKYQHMDSAELATTTCFPTHAWSFVLLIGKTDFDIHDIVANHFYPLLHTIIDTVTHKLHLLVTVQN